MDTTQQLQMTALGLGDLLRAVFRWRALPKQLVERLGVLVGKDIEVWLEPHILRVPASHPSQVLQVLPSRSAASLAVSALLQSRWKSARETTSVDEASLR